MADRRKAHPANAPGELFVDRTCIDCSNCRELAPGLFGDGPDQAVVVRQPVGPEALRRAAVALVSCPVGAIGGRAGPGLAALPEPIAGGVYACGYASRDSFGASSYLIVRRDGNVLVDSPRFAGPLVRRLKELGGVALMFLTHQDDVADHEKFRREFGCERVIHEADGKGERTLEGAGPWELAPDLKAIGVPGHTLGHLALLHREFLFTGDHLFWSDGGLRTARQYNQGPWEEQVRSVEKLLGEGFTWVLPGHGYRFRAPREKMEAELRALLGRLSRSRG